MQGSLAVRLFVATLALSAFAACGGGGGSGGGSMVPGASNPGSPTSTSTSSPTTNSTIRQQSAASSALAVAGNSTDVDSFGTTSGAMTFAIQRAIALRNHIDTSSPSPSPTTTCNNGVEFSQSGSGTGTYTNTIEYFYDNACTQPRKLETFSIALSSSGGTVSGMEELWDSSGNVVDYKNDSGAFTSSNGQLTQYTVQRAVAAAPSAAPFSENGISCVFTAGTPVDCGNATIATINSPQLDPRVQAASPSPSASPAASPTPFEIGFTGTVVGTQSTPAPSPSASASAAPQNGWGWNPQPQQLQLTIAGSGYTGPVQSMIAATPAPSVTPPAWSITGGTQVTTLSGTATLGFGPSGMFNNANITLNDTADGLTITFTSASHGGLSGTMTNSSGQTVASVTVDANGDGAIDYTTGATAQIRDWVVLST